MAPRQRGNASMNLIKLCPTLRALSAATLLAVTVGAILPAERPAGAAETRDGGAIVGTKTGTGKISRDQATQNALAALPGTVTDVTVEKKRGKNVWVIEIA